MFLRQNTNIQKIKHLCKTGISIQDEIVHNFIQMPFELANRNDIKYYYKYLYKASGQFIQRERNVIEKSSY